MSDLAQTHQKVEHSTQSETTSSIPNPPTTFRFTDLPSELRQQVDSILIANGDLAIADTNHLLRLESAPLIKKDGSYRLSIDPSLEDDELDDDEIPTIVDLPFSTKTPIADIRNVQFTANLTPSFTGRIHKKISPFIALVDNLAKPKNCTLVFKNFYITKEEEYIRQFLKRLRHLEKFEDVFLTALAGNCCGSQIDTSMLDSGPHGRVNRARNRSMYNLVREMWTPTFSLGFGMRVSDRWIGSLLFAPGVSAEFVVAVMGVLVL